jgi:hypothetical protein
MLERHEITASLDGTPFLMPERYAGIARWGEATSYGSGKLRVAFVWSRYTSYVYREEPSCIGDPKWRGRVGLDRDWLLVGR